MRFYFSDEQGREMKEHPLNGCTFVATGAWVIRNGQMVRERTRLETYPLRNPRVITLADFPGHKFVNVKLWSPKHIERFLLVAEPANC